MDVKVRIGQTAAEPKLPAALQRMRSAPEPEPISEPTPKRLPIQVPQFKRPCNVDRREAPSALVKPTLKTPFVFSPAATFTRPRLAIMTVAVRGAEDKYRELWAMTLPAMQTYAQRIGATYIEVDDSWRRDEHPCAMKGKIRAVFEMGFDRVAYIDADILVLPDAPSIFDAVKPGTLGMVEEGEGLLLQNCDRHSMLTEYAEKYNADCSEPVDISEWDGKYYNAGLFVCDAATNPHLPPVDGIMQLDQFYDQHYVNLMIIKHKLPVTDLGLRWNRLITAGHDKLLGTQDRITGSHCIHYCGKHCAGKFAEDKPRLKIIFQQGVIPVRIVMAAKEKTWILSRCAEHLMNKAPAEFAFERTTEPLDGAINYFNPYRLYRRTRGIDVCFHTHPEYDVYWATAAACNNVVAMTPQYRDAIIAHGKPESQVSLIWPGVDAEFTPRLRVIFPARVFRSDRKGPELWERVCKLQWVEAISTEGKLSSAELLVLYRSCDAVLITSNLEGGPMCCLEGLACGKPIIAPHAVGFCGAFGEMVIDYASGDFDSLVAALEHAYAPLKERAAAVADKTWNAWARAHWDLFARLWSEKHQ